MSVPLLKRCEHSSEGRVARQANTEPATAWRMPKPVTTGAELGSRCSVTMATSGQLQMKQGLNFQGLRPEGDTDPAFVQSSVALEVLGVKEGMKEGPSEFSFLSAVVLLVKRGK